MTSKSPKLERLVRTILAERARLAVDAADVPADADLFTSGLSSLDAVGVMVELETRLELELPDELVSRDSFRTVAAIVETITLACERLASEAHA